MLIYMFSLRDGAIKLTPPSLKTGECEPTLEDVAFLLLLGSRGRNRFDPFSSTAEDEAMIVELKVCI